MKQRKEKGKNIKNFICIICICILLMIIIFTFYLERRNISQEVFVPIERFSEIRHDITVEDSVYIEEIEDENVKELIGSIRSNYGLNTNNFGFFYYNVNNKKYYFYNENKYFTAASTVKVPVAMYYYDKINSGELDLEVTYVYKSGNFEAGGGDVTNKYKAGSSIPLSVLLEELIVDSDNTANNILISNIGWSKYRKEIAKYSDAELESTFYSSNVTCPKFSFDVIKHLYENSEKYTQLLENMKKSSFGKYLKEYLEYDVAHKYGSYGGYVHDYGIIYGKETYLVGVFTKNINNAPTLIANIGKRLVETVEKAEE